MYVCVSDLSCVAQFLQASGGCGRGGVALLHQVRKVTVVGVIPEAVTLGVTGSPPLLCLRDKKQEKNVDKMQKKTRHYVERLQESENRR